MSLTLSTATKNWCKEKQIFSKKINGGYFTPDGSFVQVPSGIMRSSSGQAVKDEMGFKQTAGWRVEFVNKDGKKESHYVSDKLHGGYKKSLKEAIAIIRNGKPGVVLASGTKLNTREKVNKKNKLGIPGICVARHTDSRTGNVTYRFMVSVANKKRTVTIGPTHDPSSLAYKNALSKALGKRQALIDQHNDRNKFNRNE